MCGNTDSRWTTTVTVRGTRLRIRGLSGFLCLSFFAAAKKVSAAPHRGNTNIPITNQGKAKNPDQEKAKKPDQKKTMPQAKKPQFLLPRQPNIIRHRQIIIRPERINIKPPAPRIARINRQLNRPAGPQHIKKNLLNTLFMKPS